VASPSIPTRFHGGAAGGIRQRPWLAMQHEEMRRGFEGKTAMTPQFAGTAGWWLYSKDWSPPTPTPPTRRAQLGQFAPHPIHLFPSEPGPKCDAIAQVPASTRSPCTSEFAWADEFAHEEAQRKQYRRARALAQSMCRHDGPARDEERASAGTRTSRGRSLVNFAERALFYVCGSLLFPHLA
jgi:hypothetical protein